jgi:hypothetical protein
MLTSDTSKSVHVACALQPFLLIHLAPRCCASPLPHTHPPTPTNHPTTHPHPRTHSCQAWLKQPLVEPDAIRGRLDLVEALAGDVGLRDAVRDGLRGEGGSPSHSLG